MRPFLALLLAGGSLWLHASESPPSAIGTPRVIVIVGAPGESGYEQTFRECAQLWEQACAKAKAPETTIGLAPDGATNDLSQVQLVLEQEPAKTDVELWLVFIGHGTFDGKEAKFNLRGPDLALTELGEWLKRFDRPLAVINTASASGPFLKMLSGHGRVVITATRSGYEQNFTRFGQFFAKDISDLKADLDKDGQVSLLEAFLMAAHDVAEFYKTEGRLATEHALLDDNGDGLGTPPDWFRGIRAVKKPAEGASLDGLRAHQLHLLRSDAERMLSPEVRARRNQLEIALDELRQAKEKLAPDDYYNRLEPLLLELARLYEASERAEASK